MRKYSFVDRVIAMFLLPLIAFTPAYPQTMPQTPVSAQIQEEPRKPLPQDHVLAVVENLDEDIRDLLVLDYLKLFEMASSVPEETRVKLEAASATLKRTIEDAELTYNTEVKRMKSERDLLGAELERVTKSPLPTAKSVIEDRKRIEKEISNREKDIKRNEKKIAELNKKLETENKEKERNKLLEERQELSVESAGLGSEQSLLESQLASLGVYSSEDWQKQKKEKQHLMRCSIQVLDAALSEETITYAKKKVAYYHADAKLSLLVNWPTDERGYLNAIDQGTISNLLEFSDVENIGFRTLQGDGWKSDEKAQLESIKMGEEIYKMLKDRNMIKEPIEDPAVQNFVQDIRDEIVSNSDIRPGISIKVVVINDDEINAFAIPGYFFINKGLFLAFENKAQLVGVMAHEIAHNAATHLLRGEKAANKRGLILQIAQIALYAGASLVGIPLWLLYVANYGLQFGTILLIADILHISREYEAEADILGAQYAWKAGYDPRAFTTAFDLISRISKRDPRAQGWFVTHPSDYSRMRNGYAESLYLQSIDTGRQFKVDDSRFHEVQDQLRAWNEKFKLEHPEEYRPTLNPKKPKEEGCTVEQNSTPEDEGQPSETQGNLLLNIFPNIARPSYGFAR